MARLVMLLVLCLMLPSVISKKAVIHKSDDILHPRAMQLHTPKEAPIVEPFFRDQGARCCAAFLLNLVEKHTQLTGQSSAISNGPYDLWLFSEKRDMCCFLEDTQWSYDLLAIVHGKFTCKDSLEDMIISTLWHKNLRQRKAKPEKPLRTCREKKNKDQFCEIQPHHIVTPSQMSRMNKNFAGLRNYIKNLVQVPCPIIKVVVKISVRARRADFKKIADAISTTLFSNQSVMAFSLGAPHYPMALAVFGKLERMADTFDAYDNMRRHHLADFANDLRRAEWSILSIKDTLMMMKKYQSPEMKIKDNYISMRAGQDFELWQMIHRLLKYFLSDKSSVISSAIPKGKKCLVSVKIAPKHWALLNPFSSHFDLNAFQKLKSAQTQTMVILKVQVPRQGEPLPDALEHYSEYLSDRLINKAPMISVQLDYMRSTTYIFIMWTRILCNSSPFLFDAYRQGDKKYQLDIFNGTWSELTMSQLVASLDEIGGKVKNRIIVFSLNSGKHSAIFHRLLLVIMRHRIPANKLHYLTTRGPQDKGMYKPEDHKDNPIPVHETGQDEACTGFTFNIFQPASMFSACHNRKNIPLYTRGRLDVESGFFDPAQVSATLFSCQCTFVWVQIRALRTIEHTKIIELVTHMDRYLFGHSDLLALIKKTPGEKFNLVIIAFTTITLQRPKDYISQYDAEKDQFVPDHTEIAFAQVSLSMVLHNILSLQRHDRKEVEILAYREKEEKNLFELLLKIAKAIVKDGYHLQKKDWW